MGEQEGHFVDHDESVLMAKLATVNTRIARFIGTTLDNDAARPHASDVVTEGMALGHELVIVGREVRRHARLRNVRWGHVHNQPTRGHIRTGDGPAICGEWLIDEPPSANFTPCSMCLAILGQEP